MSEREYRSGVNYSGLVAWGAVVSVVVGILWAVVWMFGSNNAETPAGYVGYVTQSGVMAQTQFIGTQIGPTSTGKKWLYHVTNVSVTPYTYDEEFNGDKQVLSKDHMQISFAVHVTFRINPEKVQDFVDHYSTMQGNDHPDEIVKVSYQNFMQQRLRTFARQGLEKYNWQELSDHISEISQSTQEGVMTLTKNTPFDVMSVVVGNIQFPASVAASVADAQAATQVLNRKEQEIKQSEADARKKVVEAKGVAESMDLIQQKLTPQYLQYQAILAMNNQIASPNHTIVYIPTGAMGVPITGTFDTINPASK